MSDDAAAGIPPTRRAPVSAGEYDDAWIAETWGWDDPDEFASSQGRNLRPRVRRAIELAAVRPGMRVLDVGCGRGEVVLECARRGATALGVDYSTAAIALARRALAACPDAVRGRASFAAGDAKELGAGREPFDRIFLLDLVEHLYDWELAVLLRRLEPLLGAGGRMVIHTLPNAWLYDVTYGRIVRLFAPWLKENPRSEKEVAIHVNEMSITHLDQLMRHCGFACRTWLEEWITAQARWHARTGGRDARGTLYRWMARPAVGALYRAASRTPARLLLANDIFCVAWRRGERAPVPPWRGWMERAVCAAGRRLAPWSFAGSGD